MSVCQMRGGKGWQNNFDSGLFRKLSFPTRTAHPDILKSCRGCRRDDWYVQCVTCVRGLFPAWSVERRHTVIWTTNTTEDANRKKLCMYTFLVFLLPVKRWMSGGEEKVEGMLRCGDAAVEHGTMGGLWHQPLDSPRSLHQRHQPHPQWTAAAGREALESSISNTIGCILLL